MYAGSGDTIAAPITPPGRGAIAVVRVSGPDTRAALSRILADASPLFAVPGRLVYSAVLDAASESDSAVPCPLLDHALAVFFAGPHSFTGEDCAEISLHGSPYLLRRLLEGLARAGVRSALPGEFSQRAFLNGKMDLSQAEAVADLIAAETEAQARAAREQLEGRLSRAVSDLAEPLRDLLAQIEAYIDFPEEDIEPLAIAEWRGVLERQAGIVAQYLDSFSAGRICREGANVVMVGVPNAGKSSLLNRIVGEERVIVSPVAGTTRDSIEEYVSFDGLFVRLWDTAGLVSEADADRAVDPIERAGIQQSWKRIRHADLVVYVFDVSKPFEAEVRLFAELAGSGRPVLVAANKIDLPGAVSPALPAAYSAFPVLPVSAASGAGIPALKHGIAELLAGREAREQGRVLITNRRHRDALEKAEESLTESLNGLLRSDPPELTALLIRSALGALEDIVGVTTTEDILGRIFSQFCIGK